MALTGRAVLLALLGLVPVALLPSWWTVVAVAALLVLLAVADVALAAPVSALRLTRGGATGCRLGTTADVQLSVVNTATRGVRGVLRDAWVPSAGASPKVHALEIPAGERRVLTTTLRPTRRGDRLPVRITVRSVGPLGLAARQGAHVVPWRVRVQPPFTSRKFLPERLARLRQLDGLVAARTRGQGTEFDSLRDYVDGDDVRSIDWRATARRGDVVVRTWRPERDRRVVIVLDTGRTSAGRVGGGPTASDPGGWPRLDWARGAGLGLSGVGARAGGPLGL